MLEVGPGPGGLQAVLAAQIGPVGRQPQPPQMVIAEAATPAIVAGLQPVPLYRVAIFGHHFLDAAAPAAGPQPAAVGIGEHQCRMAGGGAQAVVLACTEIGLLLAPGQSALPMIDSAEAHAAELARVALAVPV